MKYIVIRMSHASKNVEVLPFICPDSIVHADFANAVVGSLRATHPRSVVTVVRAGYLPSMGIGGVYGHSTTLGLKSDPEDDHLIRMSDYGSSHTGLRAVKRIRRTVKVRV